MDWFRMYGDMPNDPKIGTLSDSEFRTWVELLCAACKAEAEGSTRLTEKTVNWALRRDVTENVTTLSQIGLVTVSCDGEYVITKWKERQFESDSSTKRTRKYRERKAAKMDAEASNHAGLDGSLSHGTSPERHGDALEQNRTDTEQSKEKTLSGKPDVVTQPTKSDPMRKDAVAAIEYLNAKTGRSFRPVQANIEKVAARLREGFTLDDVKAVIDVQVSRWRGDAKMEIYLRPATLFGREKFASYAGQTTRAVDWWTSAGFRSQFEAENAGCNQWISDQWRNGRRLEVTA